uniref:Uncharacterized protein n=1 Tax=Rhizophora mucronata TaxID=61149 RepID=A0A2P2P700_RHIMU
MHFLPKVSKRSSSPMLKDDRLWL